MRHLFKTLNPVLSTVKLHIFSNKNKNVISTSSLLLLIITYSPLTSHSSLKLNFFPSSRIPASQNAVVSKAALFPPLTFLYILFIYKLHTQFLFEIFSILEM